LSLTEPKGLKSSSFAYKLMFFQTMNRAVDFEHRRIADQIGYVFDYHCVSFDRPICG